MREKFHDVVGEIEAWYDDYVWNGADMPDMVAWMRQQNMPQQFVNQIAEVFQPRMEELEAAKAKNADEQLKEGYAHLDKAKVKQIAAFYDRLTTALETYGAVKKAVRKARVKKPPSKEKLVKKVKYCAQHTELNLVSINPVDILGCNQLWVYNVKTRKLGRYVAAADAGQLGIKGSAIVGFDAKKSVAKTLRKPAEQLKQFANSGKVALRTFIEDIKAVEVELNGRLSNDVILLKSMK
jgi:predicted XRE-type DNA-binding protein